MLPQQYNPKGKLQLRSGAFLKTPPPKLYDYRKQASFKINPGQLLLLEQKKRDLIAEGIATVDTPMEEIVRFVDETTFVFDSPETKSRREIEASNEEFEKEAEPSVREMLMEPLPTRKARKYDFRFDGFTPIKSPGMSVFKEDVIDGRNLTHVENVAGQVDINDDEGKHEQSRPFIRENDNYEVALDVGADVQAQQSTLGIPGEQVSYSSSGGDELLSTRQREANLVMGRAGNIDQFTVTDVNADPNLVPESSDQLLQDQIDNNANGDDYDFYTDPSQENVDTDQSGFTRSQQAVIKQEDRASLNRTFGRNRELINQPGGGAVSEGLSSGMDMISDIVETGTRVSSWFTKPDPLDTGSDDKFNPERFKTLSQRLAGDDENKPPSLPLKPGGVGVLPTPPLERPTPASVPLRPIPEGGGGGGRRGPKISLQPIINIPAKRVAPRIAPQKPTEYGMADVRNFRKQEELYPYKIPDAYHKTNFINQIRNDKATYQKALHLLDP